MQKRKMGYEVEAWVSKRGSNEPADVAALISHLGNSIPKEFGSLTHEPGAGSIEFVGSPGHSPEAASTRIKGLAQTVRDTGHEIFFSMHSPFPTGSVEPENVKARYGALWQAAKQVVKMRGGTDEWKKLGLMNERAATHAHYSWEGAEISDTSVDRRAIVVMNILKLYGPRFARLICKKYRVDNAGHLGIWFEWAEDYRFSAYDDWYMDFEDLKRKFEAAPRFIKCVSGDKEGGEWEVDLKDSQSWTNLSDHGCWWHTVRARPKIGDKGFGTLEIRLLPSLPLGVVTPAMQDLDRLVTTLFEIAPEFFGIECARELSASAKWKSFARSFPVAGCTPFPAEYTREMWNHDVFH